MEQLNKDILVNENKNNNITFDFGDEEGSNRLNINTSRDTINDFIIYTLDLLEK